MQTIHYAVNIYSNKRKLIYTLYWKLKYWNPWIDIENKVSIKAALIW